MKVLTTVTFCVCVFLMCVSTFGSADPIEEEGSVDVTENSDVHQDDGTTAVPEENESDEENAEESDTTSDSPDEEEDSDPVDILPPEVREALIEEARKRLAESNREVIEEIRKTSDEAKAEDLGLGFTTTCHFEYTNQGVDDTIPEHFYRGDILSYGISLSHLLGFRLEVENLTSVEGGSFGGDLGDRTILSAEAFKSFGSDMLYYGSLRYRWVHTNYMMETDFLYADWHRPSVQFGISHWLFHPFVFVSPDIPFRNPGDKMAVYGGLGFDITFHKSFIELYVGTSISSSLFWYNQKRRAAYRLYGGCIISVRNIHLNPEIKVFGDVFSDDRIVVPAIKLVLDF